jgi:hypothetical protein
MYINQIDQIIDQILDNFYLDVLDGTEIANIIINGSNSNFVEYRDRLNKIILDFVSQIDIEPIQELINNKENIRQIIDIIRRYIAYYLFMFIIYYYKGTQKMFIDNVIQYSKFQETGSFHIKNFFNSENNYQLINFYPMIKDIIKLLFMTDMQKKSIDVNNYAAAIEFLNDLGSEYIDNVLILYSEINGEPTININVHNLIKTIAIRELYLKQEKPIVFRILNEIEENENEYRYIEVIIANEEFIDFNTFKQMLGLDNNTSNEVFAHDFYKMMNQTNALGPGDDIDKKNTMLLQFPFITPIVDDFLRYHKDSERIDVSNDKNFVLPVSNTGNNRNAQLALIYQQRKKKENTRIQLVINKIDNVMEYYSSNVTRNTDFQREIKKYFYQPLVQRKAILYNEVEEINIMKKIINQGRRAMENNEYFLELRHYNAFPYLNFKDFMRYGAVVEVEKTIDVMRYCNIEYAGIMGNSQIELRSGSSENPMHLVGLMVSPFNGAMINCVPKDTLIDIRSIEIHYPTTGDTATIKHVKDTNGYVMFLKIIRHFVINPMKISTGRKIGITIDQEYMDQLRALNRGLWSRTIYWIYDIDLDKVELTHYEDIKASDFQDYIKTLNSEIYDHVMHMLSHKLDSLLVQNSALDQHKIDIFVFMFNKVRGIMGYSASDEREIIVSYLARKPRSKPTNYAYEGQMVTLPRYVIPPRPMVYNVYIDMSDPTSIRTKKIRNVYKPQSTKNEYNNVFNSSNCQHEIEWKELNKIRKVYVNKYNEGLTKFIETYAIETQEADFVCKSCARLLDIKQLVEDGKFDDNQQKVITNYAPMDVALEDLREYQKYDRTIKFIEKTVDRISLITKVNIFVGNAYANRIRRRHLVKNIIDIIVTHNTNMLRQKSPNVNSNSNPTNVNTNENVFFFELDDNIFNFKPNPNNPSEIDLNKFKFNNILLYFILEFLPEITDSQILTMSFDKVGNVFNYEKYSQRLFTDVKIKKSLNTNEMEPALRYPVLCYLLYLLSYFIIKYNLWYMPMSNTKSFNPVIQKSIINSSVDLLNSILIEAGKNPNNMYYQLFAIQFYNQNNHLFKRAPIVQALHKFQSKYGNVRAKAVVINHEITNIHIDRSNPSRSTDVVQFPLRKIITNKMGGGLMFLYSHPGEYLYHYQPIASNRTNCDNGEFYRFRMDNGQLITKNCDDNLPLGTVLKEEYSSRTKEYYYYMLQKMARIRCLCGDKHDFNVQSTTSNICNTCQGDVNHVYTIEELDSLAQNIQRIEDGRIQSYLDSIRQLIESETKHDDKAESLIESLVKQFNTSQGKSEVSIESLVQGAIGKLIATMSTFVGKNTNLGLTKYPLYLNDNVYIIDHNYDGAMLTEPIIILESDGKVTFREDHPFFKTDVFYYTDNRVGQIDVFYHAKTLRLLGYKERQKDYVINNRSNLFFQINYSIKYRIYYMGYESRYIDIKTAFDQNKKIYPNAKNNFYHVLNVAGKEHVKHLKEVTNVTQKYINLVKYFGNVPLDPVALTTTPVLQIISKYGKLLNNINYGNKDSAFNTWNIMRDYLQFQSVDWKDTTVTLDEENYYLNSDIINYYDLTGGVIMYYFVTELNDIIASNPEKIVKNNLILFIISIINTLYDQYNIDNERNNLDLKRFDYILLGSSVFKDILVKGQSVEVQSSELEDIGESNEAEDARESAQALDIEGRADYEEEYEDEYAEGGGDFD